MIKPHLQLDIYKTGHKFQYPENTQWVYSNLTARSASHFKAYSFDGKVVFFGLQAFIKSFLIDAWNEGFFNRPKGEVVSEYKRRMDNCLGPDAVPVDHIAALWELGYLPLQIMALPEGSRVNLKVPMLTIENTDDRFFWLTNYVETVLSAELWHPTTVATIAYEYRKILDKYVELTGANKDFADWQLHDFSMRGLCGMHVAGSSGAAHLVGTQGYGTDTLPAIDYLEDYYGANSDAELVGGSVPASEHSVMCINGQEGELEIFKRLITQVYPTGVVSLVSDGFDFWKVVTEYAQILKEDILNRQPNTLGLAKVVFRPDSGDPVKIIAGLRVRNIDQLPFREFYDFDIKHEYDVVQVDGKFYEFDVKRDYWPNGELADTLLVLGIEVPAHEVAGAVQCLFNIFGGTQNDKGFWTLNQRVGLIYGDSISLEREEQILKRLLEKGFASDNIVFGIGSYSYQYVTRDTFGMAVKATAAGVGDEFIEVQKDPKTGDGFKKSAKGLLRVEKVGNDFILYDQQTFDDLLNKPNAMKTVFLDGKLYNKTTFAEVKQRVKESKE